MEMTVTVITRDRAPILAHCLRALANQTLHPSSYEILIVDDTSTDDTSSVIEAARRDARCAIRVSRLTTRSGIPAARNVSIREARGDLIVFVDSDELVHPSLLAIHLACHGEDDSSEGEHVVWSGRDPVAEQGIQRDL